MMVPSSIDGTYELALRARRQEGPTVLAFLFAQSSAEAIRMLDSDGSYFDHRSGESWDLYFPGYYRSDDPERERSRGARPVGSGFAADWFFDARGFELLRDQVQSASEERWKYSGRTDLVLICAWLPKEGEPTIDWSSTISGSVTDAHGTRTLTLGEVIERITNDLESGDEDPDFGVGAVMNPHDPSASGSGVARDLIIGTLSGIGAALGKGALAI
jgi:hypothetical protein